MKRTYTRKQIKEAIQYWESKLSDLSTDTVGKKRLIYDEQLDFKKWALGKLRTKKDLFYFDSVIGVDSKNDKNIPGLIANGTQTWDQALDVLKQYFSKNESTEKSDSKILSERKMSRQELDDYYNRLRDGEVEFDFIKKDGTRRHARGTLNPGLMPSEVEQRRIYSTQTNPDGTPVNYDSLMNRLQERKDYMPYFWDLDNNGYRQFHVSRFEGFSNN